MTATRLLAGAPGRFFGGSGSIFAKAVLVRYRAGIPWRDLPKRFADRSKLHTFSLVRGNLRR
jgi:hypothetical protein